MFSSQIRSISIVADFWLISRIVKGLMRWITGGKYPSRVENFDVVDWYGYFRF